MGLHAAGGELILHSDWDGFDSGHRREALVGSTLHNGLMVQRDDTALAWRQSQFDSGWVH